LGKTSPVICTTYDGINMRIGWGRKTYVRTLVKRTLENQTLGTIRRWKDNVNIRMTINLYYSYVTS
jgi:hypothetical protein